MDWLETLPARANVLSIGPEAERLRAHYLHRNPGGRWVAREADSVAQAATSALYDLLVIGASSAADPRLADTLKTLDRLLAPEAVMSLTLRNASAQSRLVSLDLATLTSGPATKTTAGS